MPLPLPPVFTTAQALDSGLTPHGLRRLLRRGELVSLRPGILTTAAAAACVGRERHALDVRAAQLAVAAPTWASHGSAACLLGSPQPPGEPRRVTLTAVPSTARPRRYPGLVVQVAGMPPADRADAAGIPMTGAARTVVDLARHGSFAWALVAGDDAVRRGLASTAGIAAVVRDCHLWPRIRRAARVAPLIDGRRESVLESLSYAMFVEQRLPTPECQVTLADDDGERVGRVDFLWREARLVGEADGKGKYADVGDLWAEKRREDRLRALGYDVVRWGWADVVHHPEVTAARIRAALARRAPRRTA